MEDPAEYRVERPSPPYTQEDLFRIHSRMLVALFLATIVVILVVAVPLWISRDEGKEAAIDTILLVLFAGALGAFVSALQRAHSFENLTPALLKEHAASDLSWFLYIYALIPPLIGAISAVVIYVFFQSQVVSTAIFPEFICKLPEASTPDGCNELNHFFEYGPKGMSDYAKCLVWGFAAGFSERLVPNLVAKLAEKIDKA